MPDDYTPSMDEIRMVWAAIRHAAEPPVDSLIEAGAEFDRAITTHDRTVAEKAWDQGFNECADMWAHEESLAPPLPEGNPYRKEANDE